MNRQANSTDSLHLSDSDPRTETRWPTFTSALLAAVGLGAWLPMACAQPASNQADLVREQGVDSRIRPGDDFNAYANGGWLKATLIPADKNRWGVRDEIDEKTRRQLAVVVEEATARPAGSYGRKVAVFHAAYLDEAVIEAKGIAPVKPLLDRIGKVHDGAALTRLLGGDLRADVDPLNLGVYASTHLFGLSVERGIHGEKHHFAYVLQGGLGLSDREAYLDSSPRMQALRRKYQDYIGHMLQQAGFDHTAQRAQAVMALETAIARTHAPGAESANDRNADKHWSRADFSSKAPGMDWSVFFAAAGLSKQNDFVAWQPDAIAGEAALVASQPLETWKDYLRFHVIDRHADVLPRAFAEPALTIHAAELPAASTLQSRERRALDATSKAMPEVVGRLYVEKYFRAESKAKLRLIAANVMDAFGRRIEAVSWMTPATKSQALIKLKRLYIGVGYPEKWNDYSGLTIDPRDAFGNQERASDVSYRQALAKLDRPTDATEWVISPSMVAAFYLPLSGGYNFSAALLQAPKFDPAASDATNYGSIGAILGHEISHFFDTLGADYDAAGAMNHWWLPEDEAKFEASAQALVDQYSGYHPLANLSIDGRLALSENIADLGGLCAAFDAYRRTLGGRAADRDYVRQQDRQFFIGFARAWRVKMSDDALRAKAATDHAPEGLRIATVRNMDAWYEAFDVLPGQRLYLEPKARVRIW